MSRVRKQGNLRLVGSALSLREKARKYLIAADHALAKARALYERADQVERDVHKAEEMFYRQQHYETCEECQAKGVKANSREVGFHLAHLGKIE